MADCAHTTDAFAMSLPPDPHAPQTPYQTLTVGLRSPGVAQVTMNRPEVFNAFDERMVSELDRAFEGLDSDPSVRAIVLAGEGRHFSAGADLQWMQRASEASPEWNRTDARRLAAMFARIAQCRQPTVARVHGAALGGGVGLACACDIALATPQASFTLSEVRLGILPAAIGPYLVNAVGKRQALRLALTAARVSAADALAMGLVQQCVPVEELDACLDATLAQLLAGGPQAQAETKRLMAQLSAGPVTPRVQEMTAETIGRVRGTDEAREGFAAFMGKRPAAWIPAPDVPDASAL